jgi:large subunit ribosomal protein L21
MMVLYGEQSLLESASFDTGKERIYLLGRGHVGKGSQGGANIPASSALVRWDTPLICNEKTIPIECCVFRIDEVLETGMYAVIKTGGKQYKVAAGGKLKVETLPVEVGGEVEIKDVLMVADGADIKIGAPMLAGASVRCTVLSHGRGEKVMIFKMRRRKHYRKTQGHRQNYTEIRIDGISVA